MKYIIVEQLEKDQIMIIQDDYTKHYFIVIQSVQYYSYCPDYISKEYKTKKAAINNFNKLKQKHKLKYEIT